MKKQEQPAHQLLKQKALIRPKDAVSGGYSRMYLAQLAKLEEIRKMSSPP